MAQKIFKKINILEMHSSLGYAGGQKNMFTFAKNLDKNIFNVFVASYVEGGMHEEKLREIGIEFIVSKKDVGVILEFIKEKRIDIIHIHRSGGYVPIETQIFEGAKKINEKIIVVEKNVFGKYDNVSGKYIECSFFQSMMHLNERYLPAAETQFDFDRMKVFYNMVDSEEFEQYRLSESEILAYKNSIGISATDFVIGKIARPDLSKWSDLVLDMMPYLIKLIPCIKFIIIGVPKSRVDRIKKSEFAQYFILLQETSDQQQIHRFYQLIDVLAHASKIGECNGNTINEAMFWRKPVITNSTPHKDNGQLEQVNHTIDGIIANHPQTFARAVAYLYNYPEKRKNMGEKGHVKVLARNNPAIMTRRLEKVFIEKMRKEGIFSDLLLENFYGKILYYPNKEDIKNYKSEYRKRLEWEFENLTMSERMVNALRKPWKVGWKIVDFLEHRYKIKL